MGRVVSSKPFKSKSRKVKKEKASIVLPFKVRVNLPYDPKTIAKFGGVGLLAFVLLVCLAFGLRKKGPGNIYPVHGEVFVNGQPAPGATVTFHPARQDGGNRIANGTVDQNGSFQLSTFGLRDGAMPGDYRVTVTWSESYRDEGDLLDGPDKLGGKYANPEDGSAQVVTVEPSSNSIPRFNLVQVATKGQ